MSNPNYNYLSSQRTAQESERRRSSVYSRIYEDAQRERARPGTARYAAARQEEEERSARTRNETNIPTIDFNDVNETARRQVRHISRLEMIAQQDSGVSSFVKTQVFFLSIFSRFLKNPTKARRFDNILR